MSRVARLVAAGLLALGAALPPPPATPPVETPAPYRAAQPAARHPSSRAERPAPPPFLVTAYCPCKTCCGKTDGITASGLRALAGHTVAVDPSLIPLGTALFIEGVGERVAEDTGGAIRGRRLDVFFPSHAQAKRFGRRWLRVQVLTRPDPHTKAAP